MPPDEPPTSPSPAPRKRTQFASFLTDAASDLSGFEPTVPEGIRKEARPTPSEAMTRLAEAQHSAKSRELMPRSAGVTQLRTLEAETAADRPTSQVPSPSTEEANGPAGHVAVTPGPRANIDIVKISVKVDAVTFLELKRALRLRETLQEFCLNAITRELGARTGKT
jgi:hypothetical protein